MSTVYALGSRLISIWMVRESRFRNLKRVDVTTQEFVSPEAPKTELNYDEHKRPSLTPSKVITVIHAPITVFFAIDAQFNIYINGQITHWTDG